MTRLRLTAILTFACFQLFAQSPIGNPEIFNYTKQVYRGGAQTRQITQDKNGVMYFANDEGLLTFTGARWRLYPLPNKSLVRSLEMSPDGKLYVGGQDEFGYFFPSANGNLVYHSLKGFIPNAERSFADVWKIGFFGNSVFFQTSDRIYQLTENRVAVHRDANWRFMGNLGKELVAQGSGGHLLRFRNGSWVPYFAADDDRIPVEAYITSLTQIGKDSALLTTLKHGLFLFSGGKVSGWQIQAMPELISSNLSSSFMVNENQIAIGTNLNGCFILDKKGNPVQQFSRKEGLQDNSILTIFLDREKNLWFGLHNGIDFIPYNNAVKHINPPSLKEGAGFTSHIYKNELYVGTSVGLFKFPVTGKQDISAINTGALPIRNTTGEAWNLSEVAGRLLMGHNDGAFSIDENAATPLDRGSGYWTFHLLGENSPVLQMVAGTYRGLSFYTSTPTGFVKAPVEVPVESARFVVPAFGKVWISHPYKGIYAVVQNGTDNRVKKYGAAEGVVSVNNNYLFQLKGELVLTTENGIFTYNAKKDVFEPSAFYNQHLPKLPIRYLKEDTDGNIWFVFEKQIGVLDFSTKTPRVIYVPELSNKFVAGFEHINPIDRNNILIGGEKGFYHINYQQYKGLSYPLQVLISGVSAINQNDSLLYGGYGASGADSNQTKEAQLSAGFNSLHFEFASAVYGPLANIEYSYRLEGFDPDWSEFGKKTEKDYTNLPPGSYIFKVKARNNLGNESGIADYRFTILPPWYRTTIAYLFYTLLAALGMYLFYRYQKQKFAGQQRRHEEEQRKLQYLHQLELEKAEKELVELRNARLEAEIRSKDTELASTAMHLIQKTDVLLKIREQMTKLKDTPTAVENTADLKKILKTLNEENKVEEHWQQFSLHFDTVHRNFLATLKKRYPGLTPNEQKLCAYLKMNLTTKEIAQLMNISVRGVEISRYRLRKKLAVPAGAHLFNFLDTVN